MVAWHTKNLKIFVGYGHCISLWNLNICKYYFEQAKFMGNIIFVSHRPNFKFILVKLTLLCPERYLGQIPCLSDAFCIISLSATQFSQHKVELLMCLFQCQRRKWQLTPVFLPKEFHGQRSLVGYSPWDCKESDTAERLTLTFLLSPVS